MRTIKKVKRKRKSRTPKSQRESYIQKTILTYLKNAGLLHWRQNSGLIFVGRRRVCLGTSGLPDIIVVLPPNGLFVGLEVKSAKGRLRQSQEDFRDKLKYVGARYYVVRSLSDAIAALKDAGWIPPPAVTVRSAVAVIKKLYSKENLEVFCQT
jgi:hypothetical protein